MEGLAPFFYSFAAEHGYDAKLQIELLLAYIEDTAPGGFQEYMSTFAAEMAGGQEGPQEAPWEPLTPQETREACNPPEGGETLIANLDAFFDRNLARRVLPTLANLPSAGNVFERPGYKTACLQIPTDEIIAAKELTRAGDPDIDDGTLLCGWYHVFDDGSTAAIMVVNAQPGAYVDAVLIIPDGAHMSVPNIELPPRHTLDDDFVFHYPDGTYRVIRLVTRVGD